MNDSCEVAVVGGGAAGSAVCFYLAAAGVDAVLVERDGVAAHASGYSAGGLNPLQGAGIPGLLGPMAIESYRMHLALWEPLIAETGIDFAPRIISVVAAAFDDSEMPGVRETARLHEREEGFSGALLDKSELYRTAPGLATGAVGGVHTRGNAALDSYLYTVALTRRAEQRGARVRAGRARGLRTDGDRVEAVLLEDGELSCGEVVLAMGPWSASAESWLGVAVPVTPLRGEIVRTDAPGVSFQHDLSGLGVSLHRRGDQVWIGTTEERRGFDVEPDGAARRSLMESAGRLVPAMAEARPVRHTVCLRPVSPDWLPIVGQAPGWRNAWLATGAGKKGVLISPGMGRAVSDLITAGHTEMPVEPFSPERFEGECSASSPAGPGED